MMRKLAGVLGLALLAAGPAAAEDRAVVIVQSPVAGATAGLDGQDLVRRFQAAGFATTGGFDLTSAEMPAPLALLQNPDAAPGRRVVVLAGRFVSGGGDSWLMGVDGGNPGLAAVDRAGLGLSRVVALMRDGSRQGVLLLGEAAGSDSAGPRLKPGLGQTRTAAGLTIIAGPPAAIGQAAAILASPSGNVDAALAASPSLRTISGAAFSAAAQAAEPEAPAAAAPAEPAQGSGGLSRSALPGEAEAWVRAAGQNSLAAYQDFIAAFPDGRYGAVARQRITRLGGTVPPPAAAQPAPAGAATPAAPAAGQPQPQSTSRDAMMAEIGLNLSLGERAQIQRILTAQGFDPKGSDGTFGPGTREALRGWQRAAGLPVTGYMDQPSLNRLRQAGGLR